VASSPSGNLYTRAGGFHLSPQGELQTQEGYPVQDTGGAAIRVDASKSVEIGADGSVRQDGQDLAHLAVVDFPDTSTLQKHGYSYFSSDPSGAQPSPSAAQLEPGKLESANAQPAESAVQLVGVMRQFDMLQRALAIGTEMNKRALDEVARIAT